MTQSQFADSYHDARARFLAAARDFEARTGRRCDLQRHVVDEGEDLSLDVAHFAPAQGRRLVVFTSAVHGVEGYAGSAVQCALLSGPLARLAPDCGVVLAHAVNPWGMAHFRRTNAANVDLNRNFAPPGDPLYATDNPGYRLLAAALAPNEPCRGGIGPDARFFNDLLGAALLKGYATLKQAILIGQYGAPEGLFYGGTEPEAEARIFSRVFEPLCARYDEILLIDLHTGYGNRGGVMLLFPQGPVARGAGSTADQGYAVTGDLVGYCRRVLERANPNAAFAGLVLEIGTTSVSPLAQLRDLRTMVRENQLRLHGARDTALEREVKARFRELFFPADPAWRRTALATALARTEELLQQRGMLGAGLH